MLSLGDIAAMMIAHLASIRKDRVDARGQQNSSQTLAQMRGEVASCSMRRGE